MHTQPAQRNDGDVMLHGSEQKTERSGQALPNEQPTKHTPDSHKPNNFPNNPIKETLGARGLANVEKWPSWGL